MEAQTYKNRYGDEYTFTRDEHHDILWEGNFDFCRIGMPNDYTIAYTEYLIDGNGELSFSDFKTEVHKYDDEKREYVYDKYNKMVESLVNEIDMVDPSGGPYITRGMPMDSFGFKGYVVKDFQKTDTGIKIITEKCAYCNQPAGIHKMGCETRKIQIHL
jgi:hypothetical protein